MLLTGWEQCFLEPMTTHILRLQVNQRLAKQKGFSSPHLALRRTELHDPCNVPGQWNTATYWMLVLEQPQLTVSWKQVVLQIVRHTFFNFWKDAKNHVIRLRSWALRAQVTNANPLVLEYEMTIAICFLQFYRSECTVKNSKIKLWITIAISVSVLQFAVYKSKAYSARLCI